MAVFANRSVLLELKTLPVKEKKRLKSAVTENGGGISFVVNDQCSLVVTSDVSSLSSNRLRSIQKHRTPVVGTDYVYSCVASGALLPVDEYRLDTWSPSEKVPTSKTELLKGQVEPMVSDSLPHMEETGERSRNVLERFRIYSEADSDLPMFPKDFQVAKYSVYEKLNSSTWCVLELQSVRGELGRRYRVVRYWKSDIGSKTAAVRDKLVFLSTSEDALEAYLALRTHLQDTGLQLRSDIPPQALDLGSGPLQQLLLEEKLNAGSISQEVGVFVELLWTEALGCLGNILRGSIDKLSLNDVSKAEGLLLQAQRKQREGDHAEVASLLEEVYTLLPHRAPQLPPSAKLISQKLDLCQLIRDVLSVSEMTLRSPTSSCVGKYRALRCSIEAVPPNSPEIQSVTTLLQDRKVQIQQVLRVSRGVELQMFKSELGNVRPLLHSSSPSNFVGILSRGLLLPRVGVEHHGIERTDIGNLGSGIYFADAVSTSLKYSKPTVTNGSRLLLVCDVALGHCKDLNKRDVTLKQAPEGHHSVHGVRGTPSLHSEFMDDEYVVYSPDQVKLKYVVQFSIEGDEVKQFCPIVNTSAELCLPSSDQELGLEEDGVEIIKNPLEDVTAGLLDSAGQQLPLQAVHVKCRLMDLLSQVIIFQKYTNMSSVPIEAKYVFPLDDSAAVCGFEAFINGKHVVGQVKEKETARKEYRQAIQKGHGAYLMDQDAPDVFTISVGNLPPGAAVLIKVTFVSELIVRDGRIFFSLPGSVAPWQERAALNQTTQVSVDKVCVSDETASTREFTLDMSIEMPYEISGLECITHKVKMKRTDCKAVVSVLPGEVMGPEGFQLSVTLSEVHLPRMWVEKHPDKDSQACMLVFYPDFDISSSSTSDEVVLLLDTSESMKGESLRMAQRIALQVLKTLDRKLRLNVVLFGTDHKEAFLTAQPLVEVYQGAERFIKRLSPVGGSTELWRPLRALSLLPPTRGVRNLLLLSDGHIQSAELTLQLLRDNTQHSRLFTCGLSTTANRHMLRALAQAGGGAYEFFDTKTKHNWAEKVACQVKRMSSAGCSSVSVKWQQFNPRAPTPVQAPKQIHALFSDCHTLVYGFVPHCTQATLLGNLSGQELKTMVSTSELQKTRGTFLHKLTARALIRDYEDGNLDTDEAEHEGKKAELKSFIVELSKEFSILSQFTSFVAIEERDSEQTEQGFTDIPKLIAEEDVDFLPYISWVSSPESEEDEMEYVRKEEQCLTSFKELSEDIRNADGFLCWSIGVDADWSSSSDSDTPPVSPCPKPYLSTQLVPRDLSLIGALPPPPPPPLVLSLASSVSGPCGPPPPCRVPFPPHPLAPVLPGPALTQPVRSSFIIGSMQAPVSEQIQPHSISFGLRERISIRLRESGRPAADQPAIRHSFSPSVSADSMDTSLESISYAAKTAPDLGRSYGSLMFPAGLEPPYLTPSPVTLHSPGQSEDRTQSQSSPAEKEHFALFDARRHEKAFRFAIPLQSVGGFGSAQAQMHPPPARCSSVTDIGQALSLAADSMVTEQSSIDSLEMSSKTAHTPKHYWRSPLVAKAQSHRARPTEIEPFSLREREHGIGSQSPLKATGFHFGSTDPLVGDELHWARRKKSEKSYSPRGRIPVRRTQETLLSEGPVYLPTSFKRSEDQATLKDKWTKIFQMQHSEGYWELTTELGKAINVDVDTFANVFLKNKGIHSLGVTAHADILRLVATLLVLQLMRVEKLEEGKLLRTLFCLDDSQPRPGRWEELKRAVDWACWADRQYPCAYSRLEFGFSWESSTRQLLGYEGLPPFSPLSGLNLQKTTAPLMVR